MPKGFKEFEEYDNYYRKKIFKALRLDQCTGLLVRQIANYLYSI